MFDTKENYTLSFCAMSFRSLEYTQVREHHISRNGHSLLGYLGSSNPVFACLVDDHCHRAGL